MSAAHWVELVVCAAPVIGTIVLCIIDPHDLRRNA